MTKKDKKDEEQIKKNCKNSIKKQRKNSQCTSKTKEC